MAVADLGVFLRRKITETEDGIETERRQSGVEMFK